MQRGYSPARRAELLAYNEEIKALKTDALLDAYRAALLTQVNGGIDTKADSDEKVNILRGEIRERMTGPRPERRAG